ncbi:MAG TPA: hypothetical protein VFF06_22435 [Polyangia bacterium]|nr:hypothetical protein [Polyangia bacterium]
MNRVLALSLVIATTACTHNLGDACGQNVDCSPAGDRFCDTSQIGGYCTVEDCDVATCPDNQPCVRFFTPILNEPCDPTKSATGCLIDETCVCNSFVAGVCASALCAPLSSERRWCMEGCGGDSDCRDTNYVCRSTYPPPTGSQNPILPGAFSLPNAYDPSGHVTAASFCVQQ